MRSMVTDEFKSIHNIRYIINRFKKTIKWLAFQRIFGNFIDYWVQERSLIESFTPLSGFMISSMAFSCSIFSHISVSYSCSISTQVSPRSFPLLGRFLVINSTIGFFLIPCCTCWAGSVRMLARLTACSRATGFFLLLSTNSNAFPSSSWPKYFRSLRSELTFLEFYVWFRAGCFYYNKSSFFLLSSYCIYVLWSSPSLFLTRKLRVIIFLLLLCRRSVLCLINFYFLFS